MALMDQLRNYHKDVYPMHMPGHKGGRIQLIDHIYEMDVTEVPGTDHLYQASGILKESLSKVEAFYKTQKSMYLVNGSTVGILSVMTGLHHRGDHVLIARNCHQSVYHGVKLNGLHPHYVYPKMTQFGLVGGIVPDDVEKALTLNPEIVSLVMTSPTYDGFVSDVKSISKVCNQHNVLLIVDEAHGAHFQYASIFPDSALSLGADVVIHSTHKTLPTFTGSGLLHMNLEASLEEKVLKALSQYQTSSPSYIMMAQIDACVQSFGNHEALWIRFEGILEEMNNVLKKMKKLYALRDYRNEEEGIIALDPLKSIIITRGVDQNGFELMMKLREDYKIQMEMASFGHMLGIMSIADGKKDLIAYAKSLVKLDKKIKKKVTQTRSYTLPKTSNQRCLPHEVDRMLTKKLQVRDCLDQVSATMITPYPPGIPMVVPGEVITEDMIKYLEGWLKQGGGVVGIINHQIEVVVGLESERSVHEQKS